MSKPRIVNKASAQRKQPVELKPIGDSGLRRTAWAGWVDEELLRELRGSRAIKAYREMSNDGIVGACLAPITSSLRSVKWTAQGADDERKEYIEQCFNDLRPSWEDTLSEILTCNVYGWSWMMPGYKRRGGPSDNPLMSSKYKDGRIGWSKWFPRSQDSWSEWRWDADGELSAMVQQCPPSYTVNELPIERSLHFRTTVHKDNPEGRSLLRTAFKPWVFHSNLETIEAIGMERDLAGIPMIERDEAYKSLDDTMFKPLLQKVRRGESDGVIIPMVYDDNGRKLIEFKLLASGGSRQFDSDKVIQRKARYIALAMQADVILIGHESVGSFALADSKTSFFTLGLGCILRSIQATINNDAIPRLLRLNGMSVEDAPQWIAGDIETPDLKTQGDFLRAYTEAGGMAFPDPDLENFFRNAAGWPKKSEETIILQEEERERNAAMLPGAAKEDNTEEEDGSTGDDTAAE